jgi:hypothetical protein
MEAARTSETLVNFYQTTRRYNPEDKHLNILFVSRTNHLLLSFKILVTSWNVLWNLMLSIRTKDYANGNLKNVGYSYLCIHTSHTRTQAQTSLSHFSVCHKILNDILLYCYVDELWKRRVRPIVNWVVAEDWFLSPPHLRPAISRNGQYFPPSCLASVKEQWSVSFPLRHMRFVCVSSLRCWGIRPSAWSDKSNLKKQWHSGSALTQIN